MRNMVISIAPVLLAMSSSALAAPAEWKISEVSGDVRLRENGRVRPAFRGALLASGATIATGSAARAVIVRGEEFIVISPRTQLRLPEAAKSNGIMQIIEDFGTAIFKIQKKSTPHFGVQTPYLAAVVKGTTFTVTAGAEGASVQVTEGAVQVSTLDGGAAELLRAGAIATVGADDLSQLSIAGETNKVIRSENSAAPATAAGKSGGPAPQSARYAGPPGQEIRIVRAVSENPKSLSEVTKGLVEGHSASDMAVAEFREQARLARREGSNPGKGDGNDDKGKPDQGKDKPTEGKNKPVKEKDKPADGTEKPSKDKPVKDADKPSDGNKDKPAGEPKDKPKDDGGAKDKPGDGDKEKPSDGGKERPDKDERDKSDDDGKSDDDKGKSGGDSGSKDEGGDKG